ncbi:DNA repair protein RecO [Sinimarinibacterium sp. CAU 1509]|uniref:DNA repair protein RecO n=1 Tax=Sinimarinibacterium sp. CAU 1509 TaxID=2562283 RepID=UPI0010ACED50|nr:DNA repair protein RecO [Sinimarinibacterium sp. CAU 1509]TJY63064.1 DNA repair protein RecO [Sinimarinibacterium sp. CAU 1509]
MSGRVLLQPAYLLSTRPYGDTSLLIEAFTPDHGRVGLVARGARAPRAKLRGQLQAFTPLLLSWRLSGEVGTMTAAESCAPPVALRGERVFFGWYLNELILRLLQRHDAHPSVYASYAELLPLLALSDAQAQAALRVFEKRLLADIGYGLMLGAELRSERRYRYDWDSGPIVVDDDDAPAYAGSHLIALRDECLDHEAARRDARHLLQGALRRQLGGRELRTPRLLRELRAGRPAPPGDVPAT